MHGDGAEHMSRPSQWPAHCVSYAWVARSACGHGVGNPSCESVRARGTAALYFHHGLFGLAGVGPRGVGPWACCFGARSSACVTEGGLAQLSQAISPTPLPGCDLSCSVWRGTGWPTWPRPRTFAAPWGFSPWMAAWTAARTPDPVSFCGSFASIPADCSQISASLKLPGIEHFKRPAKSRKPGCPSLPFDQA